MAKHATRAAARHPRHQPLRAGRKQRARRGEADQALLQRDAAGAEPEGDRRLQGGGRRARPLSRTAAATALRDAIARQYGLNPDRIVCGSGSDELINLLAHAYIGPGEEAIYSEHGFLMYKIATLSSGGKPVSVPEKGYRADVDAILAARHAQDQGGVPRQPEQSHRHLPSPRRGAPPAPGACRATCCWCSMRPTREYVRRNDYEAGLELVATTAQHGDDAHLLQDLRARGAAARLGLLPGRRRRRAQPRARAFQRQCAGDCRRRGGARRPRPRGDRRRPQREVAALGDGRDREAGARR